MEARNEMSLDKQTLPQTLELGGYRWERLKNKHFGYMYNSKGECIGRGVPYKEALALLTPTPLLPRPIPTTRTQEVDALTDCLNALVLCQIKECGDDKEWAKDDVRRIAMEAAHAQLEASQPKPEIAVKLRDGTIEQLYVSPPKPQQSDEGLLPEIKKLRATVEYWRLLAERRDARQERSGLDIPEAHTLDMPGQASAPVPTSAAVEVATEIDNTCIKLNAGVLGAFDRHKAASIIQQAMDGAKIADEEAIMLERDYAQQRADALAGVIEQITGVDIGEHSSANDPWERALRAGDEYIAATQPTAADGKLEALGQLMADVEWFIKGMHKPVGKGGAETPDLLTGLEKRLQKVKRKAALAQPASGGGANG